MAGSGEHGYEPSGTIGAVKILRVNIIFREILPYQFVRMEIMMMMVMMHHGTDDGVHYDVNDYRDNLF